MAQCRICHTLSVCDYWLWQPFGPTAAEDRHLMFTHPGWQYRGFPAIPVCDPCCEQISGGQSVTFFYKKVRYQWDPLTHTASIVTDVA
jgi:hypothetical protein